MNNKLILFLTICILSGFHTNGNAQPKSRMSPQEYITLFKDAALTDMAKTGVPASITMAQGMYESDYGNSPLAINANNHFGIKCHEEWSGATYHQDDDASDECFRKYNKVQDSYDDHSEFLRTRDRYSFLFNLDITDYKGWAYGLKKAGYATNPQYAQKLIDLIERYDLGNLDKDGSKMPVQAAELKKSPKSVSVVNTVDEKSEIKRAEPIALNTDKVNDIPFVRAKKADTWLKIARQNHLELYQLLSYNDVEKNAVLHNGETVFLKEKRNKSETPTHTVKEGDTMRSISQMYGIKLKKLYKMNKMEPDQQPKAGDVLNLDKSLLFGVPL